MSQYHPLTDKIWPRTPGALSPEGIDKIIREFLEEALIKTCIEIWGSYGGSPVIRVDRIREYFWITEVKEPIKKNCCSEDGSYHFFGCKNEVKPLGFAGGAVPVDETEGLRWCEHCLVRDGYIEVEYTYEGAGRCVWVIPDKKSNIVGCPVCLTPCPTPKPLRERLVEKLIDTLMKNKASLKTPYGEAIELADIAIQFLAEEGK